MIWSLPGDKGGDGYSQKVMTFIAGWLGVCTLDTLPLEILEASEPKRKGF